MRDLLLSVLALARGTDPHPCSSASLTSAHSFLTSVPEVTRTLAQTLETGPCDPLLSSGAQAHCSANLTPSPSRAPSSPFSPCSPLDNWSLIYPDSGAQGRAGSRLTGKQGSGRVNRPYGLSYPTCKVGPLRVSKKFTV